MDSSEQFSRISSEIHNCIFDGSSPEICSGIALGIPLEIAARISKGMSLGIYPENPAGFPSEILALLVSVIPFFPRNHFGISSKDNSKNSSTDAMVIYSEIFPRIFKRNSLRNISRISRDCYRRFARYFSKCSYWIFF